MSEIVPNTECQPLPGKRTEGIVCPYPDTKPKARLFVFPHAGAGPSAYHAMAKAFQNTGIEIVIVAYPGREMRYGSTPAIALDGLIRDCETHILELLKLGPFAFYGHSMGALVCFEYARHLAKSGQTEPLFLALTGRHAPSVKGVDVPVSHLSDEDFLDEVNKRYNAIPPEVMANPDLLELLLPAMRADFDLVANHQYKPDTPLNVPAIVVNGLNDQWISEETAEAWNKDVSLIETHWLDGDHFFLNGNMAKVKTILLNAFANTQKHL